MKHPCLSALTVVVLLSMLLPDHAQAGSSRLNDQETPPGRIAYLDLDHNLWVINADGSEPRLIIPNEAYVVGPAWSYDSKYLAYTLDFRASPPDTQCLLRVVDVESQQIVYELPNVWFQAWSPAGHQLAYRAEDGADTILLDLDTGKKTVVAGKEGKQVTLLGEWSADGRYRATPVCTETKTPDYTMLNCSLSLVSASSNSVLLTFPFQACTPIQFSLDGTRLAFLSPDQAITVANVDGSGQKTFDQAVMSFPSEFIPDFWLTFSRDGRSLRYVQYEDYPNPETLKAVDIETGEITQLYGFQSNEAFRDFSPDGEWMIYSTTDHNRAYIRSLHSQVAYPLGVTGYGFTWERVPRIINGLLAEKQELIDALEHPQGLTFFGKPVSAPGYDEAMAHSLVSSLTVRQLKRETFRLNEEDVAALDRQAQALNRYICQEKVTSEAYTAYATASSDFFYAFVNGALVCASFVKTCNKYAEHLPSFIPDRDAILAAIASETAKAFNIVGDTAGLLLDRMWDDSDGHEACARGWDAVIEFMQTILLDTKDIDAAYIVDLFEDLAVLVGSEVMLAEYVNHTEEPLSSGAQRVQDSVDLQSFKNYVKGDEEDLQQQKDGLIWYIQNKAHVVQAWREEVDSFAGWTGILGDIADIATAICPPCLAVSVGTRIANVYKRILEIYTDVNAIAALRQSPSDAERYCFDTTDIFYPIAASDGYSSANTERAVASLAFVSSAPGGAIDLADLSGLETAISDYEQVQSRVVQAVQSHDTGAAGGLVSPLLQAEQSLTREFTVSRAPIVSAASSFKGEELDGQYRHMAQSAVDYQGQLLAFEGWLTEFLLQPDDAVARQALAGQADQVSRSISAYKQDIAALLPAAGQVPARPRAIFASYAVTGLHVDVEILAVGTEPVHSITVTLASRENSTAAVIDELPGGEPRQVGFNVPQAGLYIARLNAADSKSDSQLIWVPEPVAGADGEPTQTPNPPATAAVSLIARQTSTSQPALTLPPPAPRRSPFPLAILGLVIVSGLVIGTDVLILATVRKSRRSHRSAGDGDQVAQALPADSPRAELQDDSVRPPSSPPLAEQPAEDAAAYLWQGWEAAQRGDWLTADRCLQAAQRLGHPQADRALDWLRQHRPKGK